MTINYQQWREILSTVNSDDKLDKSNVIEKIKEELEAKNEDILKQWEESGFYVNYEFQVGDNEFTLLHLAAQWGYTDLVKALIVAKGAGVNTKDKDRRTPLHLAAENGHKEVVDALLEKDGIKINEQDKKEGYTPLHLALILGRVDVANALIKKGANVHIEDDYGMTPLYLAIRGDHEELVVAMSKARKVYINVKNCAGYTPRDLAKGEKQPTLATAKGFFAGSATALLGTVIVIALSATGTVTVESQSTLIAVAAVATAALVVSGTTYMLSEHSTEMDKVEKEQGLVSKRKVRS